MKDDRGFIGLILIIFLGLFIGLVTTAFVQANNYEKAYNAWSGECYKMGGIVQNSGYNLVDCFVDQKPCQIDEYQKYATLNPNPYFNNLPICEVKK